MKSKNVIISILFIITVIVIGILMPVQFGKIDLVFELKEEVNAYSWLYYDIGSGFDDESDRAETAVTPKLLSAKKEKNRQIFSFNLSLFNSVKRLKYYVGNLDEIDTGIKKIELTYNGIPTVIVKGNQLEQYIEYSDNVEITSTDKSLVLNNCERNNYLVLNNQFVKELKSKMIVNVKVFRVIELLMIILLLLVISIIVKILYKKNEKTRKLIDSIKDRYLKCNVLELKKRHYLIYVLGIIFFVVDVFLIVLRKYVTIRFKDIGFEEIMFYLYHADGTGQGMIKGFFQYGLMVFIIAIVGAIIVGVLIHSNKYLKNNRIVFIGILTIGLIVFGCEVHNYYDELDVGVYVYNQTHFSTLFEEEYVDPDEVKITFPEKKRNLIYIYLESMESTFADEESGGISKDNYIPELTELANNNINFSETTKFGGAYCAKNTDWTIAGIVAQSCGVPLKQNLEDLTGDEETYASDNVCGGAKAIGDILDENGYNQEFILGSDVSFGKRDWFFKQHGNYKIFDYNTAIKEGKIDEDYYVW
ncbi:MAG: hypothetical protein K6F77_07290, partial [Lachnospiraceae bacterium]|nr:hypothetical protein [Lachnospiraceae bacterium]